MVGLFGKNQADNGSRQHIKMPQSWRSILARAEHSHLDPLITLVRDRSKALAMPQEALRATLAATANFLTLRPSAARAIRH
jgi:hypothetical protein